MKSSVLLFCPILLVAHGALAAPATERLSDQASPQQLIAARVEWFGEENPNRPLTDEEFNTVVARAAGVEIRLDTSRFVGEAGRIFLRLPGNIRGLKSANALRMEWKTQGVFAAGTVVAGNRAQIFQGTIPGPLMTDIFDFTMYIDSRDLTEPFSFDPIYEIDLD
ncbi:MAG: hypothetical protein L0Z68_01150 [Gammaproteobacteria bacterium]|nr:hypothetical protein [Gammaproteobacteria bacterium]